MPDGSASPWLVSFPSDADAPAQAICFAHAGGAASAYHPWSRLLKTALAIRAIQLPGRQERLREAPLSDLQDVLMPVREAILSMTDRRPMVLFGHSFGAVLAYETARGLQSAGVPIAGLVVSGRAAPHLPKRAPLLAHLGTRELVRRVAEIYGGVPEAILAEPELIDLMGPALKADLSMLERYTATPGEAPLTCPLVALAGTEDPFVSAEELDGWAPYTSEAFSRAQARGGHFYLRDGDGQAAVLGALRRLGAAHRR